MEWKEEREVRHRSKKDTRRWCKGKVGREHLWGLVGKRILTSTQVWIGCENCGRQAEYIGLFDNGEEIKIKKRTRFRRAFWSEAEDAKVKQLLLDIMERHQSYAFVCGSDADGIVYVGRNGPADDIKTRKPA